MYSVHSLSFSSLPIGVMICFELSFGRRRFSFSIVFLQVHVVSDSFTAWYLLWSYFNQKKYHRSEFTRNQSRIHSSFLIHLKASKADFNERLDLPFNPMEFSSWTFRISINFLWNSPFGTGFILSPWKVSQNMHTIVFICCTAFCICIRCRITFYIVVHR